MVQTLPACSHLAHRGTVHRLHALWVNHMKTRGGGNHCRDIDKVEMGLYGANATQDYASAKQRLIGVSDVGCVLRRERGIKEERETS